MSRGFPVREQAKLIRIREAVKKIRDRFAADVDYEEASESCLRAMDAMQEVFSAFHRGAEKKRLRRRGIR